MYTHIILLICFICFDNAYISWILLVGGFNPFEKYEFVSWDDDIPNSMESQKIPWFQTTNHIY